MWIGYFPLLLQNVYAPEQDPEMTVEKYKRSFDQNEDLGLNDMKTEGYEETDESPLLDVAHNAETQEGGNR